MPPRRSAPRRLAACAALAALAALAGCAEDGGDRAGGDVSVPVADEGRFDPGELESGRLDPSWRAWADRDRAGRGGGRVRAGDAAAATGPSAGPDTAGVETVEDITPATANRPPKLPLRGTGGPSVLHVQVLLDRAGFSPGAIDGRWGKNTDKAVYWFQHEHGFEPTGRVDAGTHARLAEAAGAGSAVTPYTVAAADLDGPFVALPDDVYEKAELDCLCYESPLERLAERFHATPELLERLNPGLPPDSLAPGAMLQVPDVRRDGGGPAGPDVARIVVSRNGFYTQGLAADGRILYHFPSTLGSQYDPSPSGDYRVTAVTFDPHFHYQPELFHEVPDEEPTAMLPPGPNSPVGVVWMQLSKPHYGIHGTSEPQTIGYTTSHGCIRLTNWDARFLARHTKPGTPVEFR